MSTDGKAPSHRREHQRTELEVAVSLESENNFWAGITDNISEGGVFVAMDVPPAVGTHVELSLTLPSRPEPFPLRGVVRWTRERPATDVPAGCGIQWDGLSREAHAAIAAFVKQRETILFDED
jgi:uncharacterized protein (TIGR02266 family)